jgi:hypothetical protein
MAILLHKGQSDLAPMKPAPTNAKASHNTCCPSFFRKTKKAYIWMM